MEAIWWVVNVIGAGVLLILGVSWLSEKIDYEKEEGMLTQYNHVILQHGGGVFLWTLNYYMAIALN